MFEPAWGLVPRNHFLFGHVNLVPKLIGWVIVA